MAEGIDKNTNDRLDTINETDTQEGCRIHVRNTGRTFI